MVVPCLEITCSVSHSHLVTFFFFLKDNVYFLKERKEQVKFNSAPAGEKQLTPPASPLQPVANSFLQAQARTREEQEKETPSLEPVTKRKSSGAPEKRLRVTGEPVYKFK